MKFNLVLLSFFIAITTCFAQNEPSSQPTNLNFSNIKPYQVSLSFSSVADADEYLVVLGKNAITFTPTDNVEYQVGEVINNQRIVKSSASTFFFIRNLFQNNTYQIAIFAYNKSGSSINYKTDAPLEGTFTTAKDAYGNYYNNIDFSASNIVNLLTNLIQPHTQITYDLFDENIVNDFHEHDTIINGDARKYVTCQYSNEKRIYSGTFEYNSPSPAYNREHRVPFTWINFSNISRSNFEETDEGCDVHSLELLNGNVNSSRSNYPFGNVEGSPWADSYLDYTKGRDINNQIVAEPMDSRKGDVARAVFYMMLAYNGKYGENWGIENLLSEGSSQDLQVLIDWHFNDLPDDFEKTRHSYVAEKQGNRNPLIDFPELVNCIDFNDMSLKAVCNIQTSITSRIKTEFGNFVYPNPSKGMIYINDEASGEIKNIHIYNMLGAEVYSYTFSNDSIDVSRLSKGVYMISLESNNKNYISKFLLK